MFWMEAKDCRFRYRNLCLSNVVCRVFQLSASINLIEVFVYFVMLNSSLRLLIWSNRMKKECRISVEPF